jgi:hypothetical protein
MASTESDLNLWYRLGYALERARHAPPAARKSLAGLAERKGRVGEADMPGLEAGARGATEPGAPGLSGRGRGRAAGARAAGREPGGAGRRDAAGSDGRGADAPLEEGARALLPAAEDLLASGLAAAVGRLLGSWGARRAPGLGDLLRAAAAGAAAMMAHDVLRPYLGDARRPAAPPRDLVEGLLEGAGKGLVYGTVVEPRVPGPGLLKGVVYGSAEYAADASGGLSRLLRSLSPQGRVPGLARLLEDLDPHDRTLAEHLVFAVTLALLYGRGSVSNGMRAELEVE